MNQTRSNADRIDEFKRFIDEQKPAMQRQYAQLLANDLSKQQWQDCFERNVLAVVEPFYDHALQKLASMHFETGAYAVVNGKSELTSQVLELFHGLSDEFLLFVVEKHRTSCALSNFPDEHKPDKAYVDQVKRGMAVLWRDFALSLNAYLLNCRDESAPIFHGE